MSQREDRRRDNLTLLDSLYGPSKLPRFAVVRDEHGLYGQLLGDDRDLLVEQASDAGWARIVVLDLDAVAGQGRKAEVIELQGRVRSEEEIELDERGLDLAALQERTRPSSLAERAAV